MLRKILTLIQSSIPSAKSRGIWRKAKGQSFVEFAITLPVALMLLSGVVEFGFALNYYLSVLDASRQAARWGSNLDPFNSNGTNNSTFYTSIAGEAWYNLDPLVVNPSYEGRRIKLDPAIDDVVVSVFRVNGTTVTLVHTHRLYGNVTPIFDATTITNNLVSGAPNAGILVVEVHHNYHQVLNLPFITPFVPDPMYLRAYSIMPLSAAEP